MVIFVHIVIFMYVKIIKTTIIQISNYLRRWYMDVPQKSMQRFMESHLRRFMFMKFTLPLLYHFTKIIVRSQENFQGAIVQKICFLAYSLDN